MKNKYKIEYDTFDPKELKAERSNEVLSETTYITLGIYGITFFATTVIPAMAWAVSKIKQLRNSIKENLFSNNWFWKVVKDENNVFTIKHINYRALLYRIDELYGDDSRQGSNLKKIFFINYNDSDWKKYKKGKIKAKKRYENFDYTVL